MFQLQFMIEKWTPELLTLSTTFCDVSRNLFPKAEMRHFGKSGIDGVSGRCTAFDSLELIVNGAHCFSGSEFSHYTFVLFLDLDLRLFSENPRDFFRWDFPLRNNLCL